MGALDWLGQKAGLAGHDIISFPGSTMHMAGAVDPSQILGALLSGQENPGQAIQRYINASKGFIGGTIGTARHPLRDPFQTALLLAPLAKGLRGGAAAEAGGHVPPGLIAQAGSSLYRGFPVKAGATRTFEDVSGFKSPADMIRKQIERDNPGAFKEADRQAKLTAQERNALNAEMHRGDTQFEYVINGKRDVVPGNHPADIPLEDHVFNLIRQEQLRQFDHVPKRASHSAEELVHNLVPFDIGQSMLEGRLGRMKEGQSRDFRNSDLRRQHDLLFGGEVHAKGEIPRQPGNPQPQHQEFVAPPRSTHEAVQHAAANRPTYDAARAKAEAAARVLHNHGFSAHPEEHLREAVNEHIRQGMGDRSGRIGMHNEPTHPIMGRAASEAGARTAASKLSARQAALHRLYRQMAHNHMN